MQFDFFYQRFQEVLRHKGWNQTKLSLESGIAGRTISTWMSKKVIPSPRSLRKIAIAAGVNLRWLSDESYDGPMIDEGIIKPMHSTIANLDAEYEKHGMLDPKSSQEDWHMLGMVHEILTSGTIFAQALSSNIRAFYASLKTEKTVQSMNAKYEKLVDQVLSLQKSTIRVRQTDSPEKLGQVITLRKIWANDKIRKNDLPENKSELLAMRVV